MPPKSKNSPSRLRKSIEKHKTLIEVVGGSIAVIVAILGVIEMFHPFRRSPDAKLEIVEFSIDERGPNPKIKVKLRNKGGGVAFLKKAEIQFEEVKIEKEKTDYAAEVEPVKYHWLISSTDVEKRRSSLSVSRKIDANDTDFIEFIVGFEELKTKLNAGVRLHLSYNEDKIIQTDKVQIQIDNSAGELPIFILSANSAELLTQLQEIEAAYTTRQIIEELTKRKYEPAMFTIRKYIQNSDTNVKAAALGYFSQIKSKETLPDIATSLNDGNAYVREAARRALIFHGEDSIPELERLLRSDSPALRELTVDILGNIESAKSEELLLKSTKDRGVAKILFGEEILVSASSIQALARIKSKRASIRIVELLGDHNISVKLAAIDAVKELSIKEAVPSLMKMQDSPEARVREKSNDAINKLTGQINGDSVEEQK